MENPQQYVDQATFKWTVGGVVGLMGSVLGAIWHRMSKVEDRLGVEAKDTHQKQHAGDDALWAAHNGLQRDLTEFKVETLRTVCTKEDLKAMEARLMDAIRSAVSGRVRT